MQRRAFLRWLTGTAAGVALAPTLDLEKLLWVPGAKTIVLPPKRPILAIDRLNGISMRFVREFSIDRDKAPYRMDVLYGMSALRPEFDEGVFAALPPNVAASLRKTAASLFNPPPLRFLPDAFVFQPSALDLKVRILGSQHT